MDIKKMIEVMQAFADGKQIEYSCEGNWYEETDPSWDWDSYDYRIKPEKAEPKYRPYKDTDELIEDWRKRLAPNAIWLEYSLPPIWVLGKSGYKFLLTDYLITYVGFYNNLYSMSELFEDYTYLDGSPCGKEVTE